MEVDSENESLHKIAAGEEIDEATWLDMRADFIARLDKIARNDFPIPKLPPPPPAPTIESRLLSPLPSSPLEHSSSQEAKKENAPSEQADEEPRHLAPGELPKQLDDMLADIKKHLDTFKSHAPHTVQRLMELLLRPKAHYKALAPYLHAVDRVVRVTSGTNTYPLPPAVPDMSSMELNGDDARDGAAAASVSWSNPTVAALGTDEALGGALLTPIPWLTRRSPEDNDNDGEATPTPTPTTPVAGAQIHSEATETIDGPNGAGSVETVSVSVNGIPSTGHHTRGVTQGELLRQEQRAGVVPVSQLTRAQEYSVEEEAQQQQQQQQGQQQEEEDGDEVPHARGPKEIGVGDTGLQGVTRSHMSEDGGVSMQGIDVEAAVGRKHDEHDQTAARAARDDDASSTSSTESTGTKREAQQELEGEHAKKMKEETAPSAGDADEEEAPPSASVPEEKKDGHGEEDGAKADDTIGGA